MYEGEGKGGIYTCTRILYIPYPIGNPKSKLLIPCALQLPNPPISFAQRTQLQQRHHHRVKKEKKEPCM